MILQPTVKGFSLVFGLYWRCLIMSRCSIKHLHSYQSNDDGDDVRRDHGYDHDYDHELPFLGLTED